MVLQSKAQRLMRAFGLVGVVLVLPMLSACSSPAASSNMVPEAIAVVNHQPASVSVQVAGGCNPCESLTAKVSNEAFSEALTNAIKKSDVFAQVLGANAADYALTVQIFHFETPAMGFSMTSTIEAGWTLTNTAKKTVVWQESITTPFTASVSDAVIGAERVKLTWEGAVRENIKAALEKISRVNLETGQAVPVAITAPAPMAEKQFAAAQPASSTALTPPVSLAPAPPPVPVAAPVVPPLAVVAVEAPPPRPVAAQPAPPAAAPQPAPVAAAAAPPPAVAEAPLPRPVAAQPALAPRQLQLDPRQKAKFAEFLTKPLPRVFVVSTNGHSASVWGQLTDAQGRSVDLRQRALNGCREAAGQDCVLYAIDDTVLSTGTDLLLE
jgi:hypothetical protein